MADAKLRIKRNLYEIEVNDKGETIVFDKDDIDLPFRLNDAFIEIEKIMKNMQRQSLVIDKKESKDYGFLTNKDEEYRKLIKKTYAQMRDVMDGVLGSGACEKIFSDYNSPDMFNQLFEELTPHFASMGFLKSIDNKIADKYGNADDDVMD